VRSATALRNIAIVVALAAIVYAVPGGADGAYFLRSILALAITAMFTVIAVRFYRERRMELFGLGDRWRLLLYAALAGAVWAIAGISRLWSTSGGVLAWFIVVGLASYALAVVWRHYREYR
jgi:hypothetical protein